MHSSYCLLTYNYYVEFTHLCIVSTLSSACDQHISTYRDCRSTCYKYIWCTCTCKPTWSTFSTVLSTCN